jgi:hypothetical protein
LQLLGLGARRALDDAATVAADLQDHFAALDNDRILVHALARQLGEFVANPLGCRAIVIATAIRSLMGHGYPDSVESGDGHASATTLAELSGLEGGNGICDGP